MARKAARKRSCSDEIVSRVDALRAAFDVERHGELDDAPGGIFPLSALRSRGRSESRPVVLVTGGVHGYETTGRRDVESRSRRMLESARLHASLVALHA
jgi:hypothetical protein